MIHTNRIVTVGEQESIIDRPIVLYRGDREVEIEFTLVGNEFTFSEEGNVIKSVNASHGQLVLNTPSGEHMFSELAECHEGKVVFVVTKEMIDEFIEMGFYSFQIRLYDSAEMKSRVTIPPVMNGFDIRNPIAAEDETNVVDQGIVDYARIFKDQSNEELPTFTWDGEYVKTEWVHHDVITENKLNKIEDALYSINANIKESDVVMLNTLDQVKKDADAYVKEHMAEVEADVEEFERNLNTGVEQFKIDTNAAMTAHKNEVSEELESVNSQLEQNTNKVDNRTIISVKDFGAKGDGVTNDYEAIQESIDYAIENRINKVFFPTGVYLTDKPILLKSDWRRSHFWGMDGVKLVGANSYNTVIKKTSDDVLNGINTSVDNINSVFILHDINNEERVGGSGCGLENIRIVHTSTDENSMCVYGKWATNKMQMKNLMLENLNGQGMIFGNDVYSSQFINIFNRVKKNALHVSDGTSNYYRMIYSPSANNPYKLIGGYSQLDVVYCDNGTGIIFDVGGSGVTMVSCGSESPNAQYIVRAAKDSHIKIDSLTIHRQIGCDDIGLDCDDTAIFTGYGDIICDTLKILNLDEVPTGKTGFLCTSPSTASNPTFRVENIMYYGTSIGNPKIKHCNVNTSTTTNGSYSHGGGMAFLRRNKFMPYIGVNNNENIYESAFKNKAIYLDNETKTTDSLGNNNAAQKPYNLGDILLINDPKEMNILGYAVTSVGTSVNSCTYTEIPLVLSGSTSERPTSNLFIGLQYFDTTIGKAIWCKNTSGVWVDANGDTV